MRKLTVLFSTSALAFTSCATTGGTNNAVGSLSAAPSVVKPSTDNIGIKQTRLIDGTFTSLYKNSFVLNIATLDKPFSFSDVNQTVGSLGPKTNYSFNKTTQFQPLSNIQPNVFCRINGNSIFIPCLIDSNNDGWFDERALSQEGSLIRKRNLETNVKYSTGITEVDCHLDIQFWKGLIGKSLITARISDGSACPKTDRISNLKSLTFDANTLPKTYTILGSEILIHSYENKTLNYTIKKPISSGLALNTSIKYKYRY